MPDAALALTKLIEEFAEADLTIATAESLTGGLLSALLTSVPGASVVVRGGVVAYSTDLKHELLGVDLDLLEERGAVDPDVARAMAAGVREHLNASVGVATTGVAGPEEQDGKPVGTVFVAVATEHSVFVRELNLEGDREHIRASTVQWALLMLAQVLT